MMNRASPVDMRKALEIEKRNSLCECKDRDIKDCEGAWEEGCDLGKNEKFASPALNEKSQAILKEAIELLRETQRKSADYTWATKRDRLLLRFFGMR
jgi:hypothetical protein